MNKYNFGIQLVFLVIFSTIQAVAQTSTENVRASTPQEIKRQIRGEALNMALEGQSVAARDHIKGAILKYNAGSPEWYFEYGSHLVRMAIKQIEVSRLYDEGTETATIALRQFQLALQTVPLENNLLKSKCYNKIAFIQEYFLGNRNLAIENYKMAESIVPGNSSSKRGLRRLHVNEGIVGKPNQ